MLLYAAFVVFGAGKPDARQEEAGASTEVGVHDLGVPSPGAVLVDPFLKPSFLTGTHVVDGAVSTECAELNRAVQQVQHRLFPQP